MYGPRNDHLTGASQAGHPPGIGGGLAVEHRFVDVALPGVHTDPSIDSGTGELEGERGGASHRMGGPVEGGDELVAAVADGSPSVAVHQVRKEAGLGSVRFVGLDGHDGGQHTMNLIGGYRRGDEVLDLVGDGVDGLGESDQVVCGVQFF